MGFIKLGNTSFNLSSVDNITFDEFKDRYGKLYKHIGKGREKIMRGDYDELKKSFTKKKRIKKEGQD